MNHMDILIIVQLYLKTKNLETLHTMLDAFGPGVSSEMHVTPLVDSLPGILFSDCCAL